ncbi:MAG: hypothetical protein LUD02_05205 [Tannerellaceae bacterium]|nr:hypothetical protein [Tannerellaceae bacterium]
MIKQICKILWAQCRSNGWIFGEIVLVLGFLWILLDTLLVDIYTYHTPLGFDVENVYLLKVDQIGENSSQYIPAEERTLTVAEDVIRLMDQLRLHPDVEDVCAAVYSTPYIPGELESYIEVAGGDTVQKTGNSVKHFLITSQYFNVFRIRDTEGKLLTGHTGMFHNPVVISSDLEKKAF